MRLKIPVLTGLTLLLTMGSYTVSTAQPTQNSLPAPKQVELAVIKEASRSSKVGVGGQLIRFKNPKKPVDAKTGDKLYLGDGLKVQRHEKVVIQCLVNQKLWTVPNNSTLWGVANGCPLPPDYVQHRQGQNRQYRKSAT